MAVAVLALGLGLALSTTMFGVIDAVLKPQSPYRNMDRLYWVSSRIIYAGPFDPRGLNRIVRDQTRSFDASVVQRSNGGPAMIPA
ncbi:MAG: hypothetical protein B7Z72_12790, partial [Gemmatimonadetes bacterium 21-71-4]